MNSSLIMFSKEGTIHVRNLPNIVQYAGDVEQLRGLLYFSNIISTVQCMIKNEVSQWRRMGKK
jgi:hypothetical protein